MGSFCWMTLFSLGFRWILNSARNWVLIDGFREQKSPCTLEARMKRLIWLNSLQGHVIPVWNSPDKHSPDPPGTNQCSTSNGGCAQLCLAHPGGRKCACGRGFLPINKTSCSQLPRCPSGEESCSDGSKCISSSSFCDGRVDCPDQSDELDCEFETV